MYSQFTKDYTQILQKFQAILALPFSHHLGFQGEEFTSLEPTEDCIMYHTKDWDQHDRMYASYTASLSWEEFDKPLDYFRLKFAEDEARVIRAQQELQERLDREKLQREADLQDLQKETERKELAELKRLQQKYGNQPL